MQLDALGPFLGRWATRAPGTGVCPRGATVRFHETLELRRLLRMTTGHRGQQGSARAGKVRQQRVLDHTQPHVEGLERRAIANVRAPVQRFPDNVRSPQAMIDPRRRLTSSVVHSASSLCC